MLFFFLFVRPSSVADLVKGTRRLQAGRSNLKSSCRSRSSHTSIDPSAHPGRTRTAETHKSGQCFSHAHTHIQGQATIQINILHKVDCRHQPVLVYTARVCHSWGGRIWLVCLLISAGIWQSCPRLSVGPRDTAPVEVKRVRQGLTVQK